MQRWVISQVAVRIEEKFSRQYFDRVEIDPRTLDLTLVAEGEHKSIEQYL
jgi:hypothetical protein